MAVSFMMQKKKKGFKKIKCKYLNVFLKLNSNEMTSEVIYKRTIYKYLARLILHIADEMFLMQKRVDYVKMDYIKTSVYAFL